MATIEFITKEDLDQFKQELFSELRRPGKRLLKISEQKEWLKSYEVLKLLSISPGTLQGLRDTRKLKFNKVGGFGGSVKSGHLYLLQSGPLLRSKMVT